MNNLYQKKNKLFPEIIDVSGNFYNINADFRNILRIFAIIKDYEIDEYARISKMLEWFFNGNPPEETEFNIILSAFTDFVNPKKEYDFDDDEVMDSDEPPQKQFDYDFDADEIFASFVSEYNIDLTEIEFLHWYKFKILLLNLSSESPFKKKIDLRFLDLKDFKGQALFDAQKAKALVQLPEDLTEEEYNSALLFNETFGKFR